MARRKPKAERKDLTIRFRANAEQRQAMAQAARREGLELSAWLRRVALKAANWEPESDA